MNIAHNIFIYKDVSGFMLTIHIDMIIWKINLITLDNEYLSSSKPKRLAEIIGKIGEYKSILCE